MRAIPERVQRILPPLALVAAALAAHGNVLGNGFVWDDKFIVVENPDTRSLDRLPTVLLSPDEMKPYYRPLTRASFLVDYSVFGLDSRAYHLVNLLLHIAAVLLLYLLGLKLFQAPAPAFFAALLLAVHPIHCEAVAFVSARNNIFALCFSLLSMIFFIDATEKRSHARAALSAAAFSCAVMSKEPGFMVLALLGLWLFVPSLPGHDAGPRRWTLLLPHLAAVAAYFVLRSMALGAPVAAEGVLPGLWTRLAQDYYVLPRYLLLALYPRALAPYHEVPAHYATLPWLPFLWGAFAAAVALVVRRPSKASVVGLLWFAVNLAPLVGVVPIPSTSMAERFFYIPAAGLWLLAADLLRRASARVPWRALAALGAAAAVALGVRSSLRNRDWRDDLSLFSSAVEAEPGSLTAHFNYGNSLKDVGDLAGAEAQWRAALAIAPEDPGTHAQLGTLAAVRGDYASAEQHYRIALHGDPLLAEAHLNLARICERTGRVQEAKEHYQAAAADPGLSAQARSRMRALEWPAGMAVPTAGK
jgi:tetratricopeptide (TPR) repeat protein